jgi:hypothetical protein
MAQTQPRPSESRSSANHELAPINGQPPAERTMTRAGNRSTWTLPLGRDAMQQRS